ncbi:UPF0262 family protein [Mesorhizobium sp. M0895]
MHIAPDGGAHVVSHYLSLAPFRQLLKDYTRICGRHYDAIRRPDPERLEANDMGRRGIHNDAAELLRERLSSKVTVDRTQMARQWRCHPYCLFNPFHPSKKEETLSAGKNAAKASFR